MKQLKNNKTYQFDKYWALGFIGFVGFFTWVEIWQFFQGNGTAWSLTNLLWFAWFLYFLPQEK